MDLQGVAVIITALTGLLSVVLTAYIILKVGQVHKLTNSNFSSMQTTLSEVLAQNAEQAKLAQQLAHDTAMQAAQSAVDAARALATPPTPAPVVQVVSPVVESITTETIVAKELNVSDRQVEKIAEAVVEQAREKPP